MVLVLNGTSGISRPLGSAGSPSDVNTSDSTTGLYFPSSNTVGISTGGTNALYIDASQKVGIGTTSPSTYTASKLVSYAATGDVWNSTDAAAATAGSGFHFYNNGTLRGEINTGGTSFASWGGANSFNFLGFAAAPMTFATNSTERMRIDSSGNVLVGTTSNPASAGKLTLSDSASETKFTINNTGTGGLQWWIGSTNNSSGAVGGGKLAFYDQTNNASRMVIDSSGNVGIGTTSPTQKLQVSGTSLIGLFQSTTTDGYIRIDETGGSNNIFGGYNSVGFVGTSSNYPFTIRTNNTERMRIDTSGNIGIGTSSINSRITAAANNNYGDQYGIIQAYNTNTNSTDNASITVKNYSGTSQFMQWQDIGLRIGSRIKTNTGAGNVVFTYGADAEGMRIDSSGNVGIGTSSPKSYANLQVSASNPSIVVEDVGHGVGYFSQISASTQIGAETQITFKTGVSFASGPASSGTEAMRIDSSGNLLVGYTSSNGSYKLQVNSQIFATSSTIATSDANYKTNVTPISGALNLVQKLNPVQFSWKQHPVHNFDASTPTTGFIAQEVQTAFANQPFLNAIVKKNTVTLKEAIKDKEGNVTTPAVTEDFLGIAEGNMIAILTKAIQELKAEFDAYKASHP
jgi:Chaperone of endosialidase